MKKIQTILLIFLVIYSVEAQWSTNPAENTPVCVAIQQQSKSCIINDNNGNVIIGWRDLRDEPVFGGDIYVQKLNIGSGEPQWTIDGKKINTQNGVQLNLDMCADGSDGAFLVWQVNYGGSGNYDLYAQHINSDGDIIWSSGEIVISQAPNEQEYPRIISDGFGGAIIVWHDNHILIGKKEVYAQRVDSSGNILWTSGGILVSSVPTTPGTIRVIGDDAGGAIIVWVDSRNGTDENIYCQRIDADGNKLWDTNDVELCNAGYSQGSPKLVSDGENGAIFTWGDSRNGFGTSDIYAQRVNAEGTIQWTTNGEAICEVLYVQGYQNITSDGKGGAIITWEDDFNTNDTKISAQRISIDGNILWTIDGVLVGNSTQNQTLPIIASDDAGGAIIAWQDYRNFVQGDIYAQRIDSSGAIMWGETGLSICTISTGEDDPQIIKDGYGGAILSWTDHRQTPQWDIYAQNIDHSGNLGTITFAEENNKPPYSFNLDQNFPNPFNPSTSIQYEVSSRQFVSLKVYDVLGNEIATLVNEEKPAGSYEVEFSVGQNSILSLSSGIYFYQLKAESFIQTKKMVLMK
jgi:hypothetical protein